MLYRSILILATAFAFPLCAIAQENVTSFGIQVKPIIPSNLMNAGTQSAFDTDITYDVSQRMGYSFGGVIRRGLNSWLTVESGISYVRRNFNASVVAASDGFSDTISFRIIGYELPVLGLVYVRLSDKIFMDAAFGLSLDFFPSHVGSGDNLTFYQSSFRRNWAQASLLANVGWELRTEKSGIFYVGASFHRPFNTIYQTQMHYGSKATGSTGVVELTGNYLTLDLRYFFHEEPQVQKRTRQEDLPAWMRKR